MFHLTISRHSQETRLCFSSKLNKFKNINKIFVCINYYKYLDPNTNKIVWRKIK